MSGLRMLVWPITYRVERRKGHLRIVQIHNGEPVSVTGRAFVRVEDFQELRSHHQERMNQDDKVIRYLRDDLNTLHLQRAEERDRAIHMLTDVLRQIGERAVVGDLTAEDWR